MSNTKEQIDALMGLGSGKPTEEVDWKQKYEDLCRAQNNTRIEEGRVKKLSSELDAAKKELAELRAKKGNEELLASLSEEERSEIPDEVLNAATKLVNSGMSRIEKRLADMEQRRVDDEEAGKAKSAESFLHKIDEAYPSFRGDVGVGGDKADAWSKYRRYNQASIANAFKEGDFETFAYHVEKFYRDHLGVAIPSAHREVATPDPVNHGGSNGGVSAVGKVYSQEEFLKLYDLAEEARDKGDYAELNRINSEIKKAQAEGRVK